MKLPYGAKALEYDFPGAAVLTSGIGALRGSKDGGAVVCRAMQNPIGSEKLSVLAQGKTNAVIIVSDHTRPVPSQDVIPNMLRELREGNPQINITLLVATGFHRGTTKAELTAKLGSDIVSQEKIVVHDCENAASNVQIGVLPSGAPLVIDRLAAEAELLVSEGFIEPHFFAGFSGGRKSVLPGISDRVTVLGNHCSKFIDDPHSRTGNLEENPLHRDMVAAARMAGLRFIVNVIIDEDKRTAYAFAGDFEKAHLAGTDFLKNLCQVTAVPGDIVVTTNGGAPLDQNIYQCVKGLTAAEATAKPGATLIMCAECLDGTGGDGFYRSLRDARSPEALYGEIMETPQSQTIPDQWESQILARVLMKHRVIFVTRPEMRGVLRDMKMEYAETIAEALELAGGCDGKAVTVIPNGISVIVRSSKDK